MSFTAKEKEKKKEKEAAESTEAVSAGNIPDEPEYERRRKPWTKDRVLALCLQIVVVLATISAVLVYKWYQAKHEQYKTGVMEGGELCIAYRCDAAAGAASFKLEGDAVKETARFAFSEKGGVLKSGMIFTPVSEGSATLYSEYTDKDGDINRERFDITVDGGLNITYTASPVTAEDSEAETKGN